MSENLSVKGLITKLLTTRTCTKDEFKRIYKMLCKFTHPDLSGGDGADFIKLQETYAALYSRIEERERRSAGEYFDPCKLITDSGYPHSVDPRSALYIGLYRYWTSGLNSYKIRANNGLRERNSLIIRTILYWAGIYDADFITVFVDYNAKVFEHIRITGVMKEELKGKRFFLEGLDWFFKYQHIGREGSKTIARDKLKGSIYTFSVFGYTNSPVIPFAKWLLGELDKDPVRLHNS